MKEGLTNIIGRILVLVAVLSLGVLAVQARGMTPGITFATYGVDLKIDSKATYNGLLVPSGTWQLKDLIPGVDKFWNFNDIKPGDYGENTISMHVNNSDAWLCIDFKNLDSQDNNVNEPESLVDSNGTTTGELAKEMEFFSWIDDGDNIFEKGEVPIFGTTTQSALDVINEKTYPIGDASWGNSCKVNQTKYVGVYWCAGDLKVNLSTAQITCDGGAMGNEAQTDSMSVDVSIRALPKAENPQFICKGKFKGIEGCSPGYWKQSQHFKDWASPYTPSTLFSSVFENAFPGKTLLQVLGQGGGGLNALGRQTVAALLNSANPGVGYSYTTAQVISMFNAAFPGGNLDALKNLFEAQNIIFCPLGADSHLDSDDNNYQMSNPKEINNKH